MQNNRTIFWDWNGTLLDDTWVCVDAMNLLLREREMRELNIEHYREVFTFPVRDYYVKIGFDFEKEAFEGPAIEFIEQYDKLVYRSEIFPDAAYALDAFKSRNYTQMILSAMQNEFLNNMVGEYGIAHYFHKISGIDDHYAGGKVNNARKLISSLDGYAGEIIIIGDTIHDHEVGEELGIRVILVCRGHQSERRLRTTGREIAHDFREVVELINP
jgi:phosphoglycolate phosphatase